MDMGPWAPAYAYELGCGLPSTTVDVRRKLAVLLSQDHETWISAAPVHRRAVRKGDTDWVSIHLELLYSLLDH